jgi:hypothetical protein
MSAGLITDELITHLTRRFGNPEQVGKARIFRFGSALTCSINYSKLLRGNKYFFGLPAAVVELGHAFPDTKLGDFVLLICGSSDRVLVLPRSLVIEVMRGVTSRRLDVFVEDEVFILQTTGHPKRDVTEYLNAYPKTDEPPATAGPEKGAEGTPDRIHLKMQSALVALGEAEGCSVWVPINDRNLFYDGRPLSKRTVARLPNFGFDENTRRIVQNIDVLWLAKNVIRKAFEIESTTLIYSGLLRLNDLVLSQPNIQIELYVAASRARRDKVHRQLLRPSFQPLLPKCQFLAFEEIGEQIDRLGRFPVNSGVRVTGLIRGERFDLPDHILYPSGL